MATYSVDDTEEIRKTLLTIAAGSLACLSARADSALVASYGAPGFDNQPASNVFRSPAAFALPSDSLFNVTGNPLVGPGLGAFALDAELPFNLSGAWVTSFSQLTSPVGVCGGVASDPTAALDFQDGSRAAA
jgi:hypothetical protein